MAQTGLMGFYVGKYNEEGDKETYTEGRKLTKAVQATITYNKSEAELYADNGLDDKVNVITKVDMSITPNDSLDEEWLAICGIEKSTNALGNSEATETYALKDNSEGDFIGIGYISTKRQSGIEKSVVYFYPKCKFYPSDSESFDTRGETIQFSTAAITGTGYKDKSNVYVYRQFFDTEAEAENALKKILGIGAASTASLSDMEMGK